MAREPTSLQPNTSSLPNYLFLFHRIPILSHLNPIQWRVSPLLCNLIPLPSQIISILPHLIPLLSHITPFPLIWPALSFFFQTDLFPIPAFLLPDHLPEVFHPLIFHMFPGINFIPDRKYSDLLNRTVRHIDLILNKSLTRLDRT